MRAPGGRGHVGRGPWLSLCFLLQQKTSTSCPLLLLVFPLAAGKNEGKLDGKAFGCPVLRISAFGGVITSGVRLAICELPELPKLTEPQFPQPIGLSKWPPSSANGPGG